MASLGQGRLDASDRPVGQLLGASDRRQHDLDRRRRRVRCDAGSRRNHRHFLRRRGQTGAVPRGVNFAAVHRRLSSSSREQFYWSIRRSTRAAGKVPSPSWRAAMASEARNMTASWSRRRCVTAETIAHIRTRQPGLFEFITYRWLEHCGPLRRRPSRYRTQGFIPGRVVLSACTASRSGRGPHRRRRTPRSTPRSPPRSTMPSRLRKTVRFRRARSSAGTCSPDRSRT